MKKGIIRNGIFIENTHENITKVTNREEVTPHIEYQDKLYNALLAIEAAIGAVEMYTTNEVHFKSHLHAVKEMLEARIDDE